MPNSWSWHEEYLKKNGATKEEIEARREKQQKLQKSWSKLGADRKAHEYWERKEEMRRKGILHGSVMGISIAALDDYSGERAFAIHLKNLIDNEFEGVPQSIPSLQRLFLHPNTR